MCKKKEELDPGRSKNAGCPEEDHPVGSKEISPGLAEEIEEEVEKEFGGE